MQTHHSQEPGTPRRYDAAMLQEVIAVASKLQQEHHERLTAEQVEEIAAEVGIEPAFVRQALERVDRAAPAARKSFKPRPGKQSWFRKHGLNAAGVAVAGGIGLATVDYLFSAPPQLFTCICLLTAALGAIGGKEKEAFRTGAAAGAAALLGGFFTELFRLHVPDLEAFGMFTLLTALLAVLAGVSGVLGAWGRNIVGRRLRTGSGPTGDEPARNVF